MARTETAELTVLCLLHQGDKYLLQDRTKADWTGLALPGGHVEPEESIVEAVIREMREETGLTIEAPRLCGVKQFPIEGGRYLVFLFRAERFTGTLISSEEGQMEWVSKAELPARNTVNDLDKLIQVMLDDGLTEFQYVIRDGDWLPLLR